jgi:hypothetical protein
MSIKDYKQRSVVVDRILDTERGIDIGERRERAAVVAWLLKRAKNSYEEGTVPGTIGYETRMVLEAIERGEHRRDLDVAALNAVLQKLSLEVP